MASDKRGRPNLREELSKLADTSASRRAAAEGVRQQLRTAARVVAIALVVVWLLALGFASGLGSWIPLAVAAVLTVVAAVGAYRVRRNLVQSEEVGAMLEGGDELSAEERAARIGQLDEKVARGDVAAVLAKAQLQMQEAPRDAIATLEAVDLDKQQKPIAAQIRVMRAMLHLNLAEVKAARELADAVDLTKAPDLKTRASFAGIVAEAWARSGNPIEASELLAKYDPADEQFKELKVQLLRARAFATAHRNDLDGMKRALKGLEEVSPQLLALFLTTKRVHPLLAQEARRRLEKSGAIPRPKLQVQRR
jgi:hypothetical protein